MGAQPDDRKVGDVVEQVLAVPEAPPAARWDGDSYATSSAHHRAADDWFLGRHTPLETDTIVDIGCGSGEFTARLAQLASRGRVTGIDPDASMLRAARRHRARNLHFVRADALEVDEVVPARSVDLVVSRAMLHWLPVAQHPRFYAGVLGVLRPGGVLHLEAAGPGHIPGISALLTRLAEEHAVPVPPPFPDPGRALEMVEEAGFATADEDSVRTVAVRRRFTREQLTGLLHQTVMVLTRHTDAETGTLITQRALDEVDRLRRHDGTWDQTFVRLEVLVQRPGQQ
jgi:ubiquinone/menaquinone biosynthesis C-methylase UbiE